MGHSARAVACTAVEDGHIHCTAVAETYLNQILRDIYLDDTRQSILYQQRRLYYLGLTR